MLQKICHNIPDGGSVTLTIEKASDKHIRIALNRKFPKGQNMQPLVLSGPIDELEAELPTILNDYRRTTDIRAQAKLAIKANEKKATKPVTKTTSKKVASQVSSDKESLDTSGSPLFAE